jgi:16S rRNA (adenine1518-N6/adenine1519-N6)-dimethyltransferase
MKQLLARRGIRLTKSLGQNFLHDANQLRRIADTADLLHTDKVLEIGPGLGPLTALLIARAGEVLAIEIDARLVELLRTRFTAPHFHLIHADALDFLKRERHDWRNWKLVANLPYSVASPILVELAQADPGPERMVATLQLEVAKRLLAQPGAPDYGVLTLLLRLDYQPQTSFTIPAGCFFPPPDVDSACVCLARRLRPLLSPAQRAAFYRIVKQSFSQRRKMMFKLLKTQWPADTLEKAFADLNIPLQARAETVTLDQFVQLATLFSKYSAAEKEHQTS